MRIYTFPVAPNPTKVALYLSEKVDGGASIELETVTLSLIRGEQKSPEHLARSPFGTLPVLELDDGSFIPESLAIIEYLEERFPEPPLLGRSAEERAHLRALERTADTRVLMSSGRLVHATKSPLGLPPNPAVAEGAREALDKGLAYFDGLFGDGRRFAAGSEPSVADCTLAAAVQFGAFREIDVCDGYPAFARWYADYRKRPCVVKVLGEPG